MIAVFVLNWMRKRRNKMTIGELITILNRMDTAAEVTVEDCDGCELRISEVKEIVNHVNAGSRAVIVAD